MTSGVDLGRGRNVGKADCAKSIQTFQTAAEESSVPDATSKHAIVKEDGVTVLES